MVVRILTLIVACACAFTVPVSQLRTFARVMTCCCPDPEHCHCPDHQPSRDRHAQLRACHRGSDVTASADPPAVVTPQITAVEVPLRRAILVVHVLSQPAPSPSLAYRDLPS